MPVLVDISRDSQSKFSSILDLVKYSRTQSLVSVASLNVRRYKAWWLERVRWKKPDRGTQMIT